MPFSSPNSVSQKTNADRRAAGWVLLSAVVLFGVMAAPFFAGQYYLADDLGEYHLPTRAFYQRCLIDGDRFDWMPQLYCGFDLTGEGQAGTYHPLHWLLYRWLPLQAAFSLELLASYPLLLVGSYFLLLRQVRSRSAAWFGAVVFTFGSFSLLHFVHPNAMAIVAHIPWLLLAIGSLVRSFEKDNRRAAGWFIVAIGLLTGSQLLLGYPQYVWFSLLAEAAYLALMLKNVESIARWSSLICWMFANLCGAMIGSVQLLATWDALSHSTRQSATPEFLANGSLHPLNLMQLVAPYLFATRVVGQNTHELGLYIGAAPIVLIAWMMFAKVGSPHIRRVYWTSLALAAVAFVFTLGQYSPLFRLQTHIPLVASFRFPCRAIVLVELALAAAAAAAFATVIRSQKKAVDPIRASNRGLKLVLVVSIVVASLSTLLWRDYVAAWPLVIAGPIMMLVAALAICAALRNHHWAMPTLAVLTVLDLGAYGLTQSVYRETKHADVVSQLLADDLPHGVTSADRVILEPEGAQSLRQGNRSLLVGVNRVDGYAGLEPARQLDYQSPAALRAAGCTFAKIAESEGPFVAAWQTRPTPLPRANLVTNLFPSSNPAKDIGSIDLESTALVEPNNESVITLPTGQPGSVNVLSDRPGRLQFETNCSTQQLLVVAESFHPGWQARIDGQPVAVVRANGDFLGCVVPPGEHRVELEFSPQSLKNGKMLTACGLCLLGISLTLGYFRRKAAPR